MSAALVSTIPAWAVKGTPVNTKVELHGCDTPPSINAYYFTAGPAVAVEWDAVGLPDGLTATPEELSQTAGVFAVDVSANTFTRTAHGLQPGDMVSYTVYGSGSLSNTSTALYVISSGFTADAVKLSTTKGGSVLDVTGTATSAALVFMMNTGTPDSIANHLRLRITGTPTTPGIFPYTITARGIVDGLPVSVSKTGTIVVEGPTTGGGNLLAFYAADFDLDPVEPRSGSIDVQYNGFSRTFTSGAVDLTQGLNLYLGRTTRLHCMASRNGVRTLPDGLTPSLPETAPTPMTMIIRPVDQLAAPAFLSFTAPTGSEDMGLPGGSTRPVPYFDLLPDGSRLRRLFRQLTAAAGPEPAAAYLEAVAQWAFTLDGREIVTPELPVKIWQPQDR